MIRDARAEQPQPATLPRAAHVNRCHHCGCCPPRPHRARTKWGFLLLWQPSQLLLFLPLPRLLLSSLLSLLLLRMPFPLEPEAPTAVVVPSVTAAYPPPKPEWWTPLALGPSIHSDGAHLCRHPHATPVVIVIFFVFSFVIVFAIIVSPSARNRHHCGRSGRPP